MAAELQEGELSIKDGDIFRWRYKDEQPEHRGAWGRYHCKSQIVVAKNGRLIDTYWCPSPERVGGMDCASWGYEEAARCLTLTPVGNLAELEKRPEWMAAYYDDADCVDLNHPNSSRNNFYIRKGAQRSRDKMLAVVAQRIDAAQRELVSAKSRLERCLQVKADLTSGKALSEVYL